MIAQATDYAELVEQLPPDSTVVLRDVSWEEYEELLDAVGEASGLRISYDEGRLQIVTLSTTREMYADLVKLLVGLLSVRFRTKVLFFGSATMKQSRRRKGAEPDGCFYVQTAELVEKKKVIDFEHDPPPDIVVEIDLHHESLSKFPIYVALGVPEIWRYDEKELAIYHLHNDRYDLAESSRSLPLLNGRTLTEFLNRSQLESQYEVLIAFEVWLRTQAQ